MTHDLTTDRASDDDFAVFRETDTGFEHVGYAPSPSVTRFPSVDALCAHEESRRVAAQAAADAAFSAWLAAELGVCL